ncbi:MAG: hypothetical protein OdinLCB4_000385 [Candidatus Odinarchaeum yellowstonii]|uniref:Uncharacterized protein n=1 Tax=Odinarchaeota yellowstonii (strain LCB_4) TaxID=1841599 RepID=A0AAF0D2D7_ODILC|nr:MAG: hypothetical protein OdinLCB4_000385 [Candidatus Odinarchaeum yellowstonii]
MSLRFKVEKLIKLYEKIITSYNKSLPKFLVSATLQVKVIDTGECFNIAIGDNLSVEDGCLREGDAVLSGDFESLKSVLDSGSGSSYIKLEKEGRVKFQACNFKGRALISQFKKLIKFM